MKRILTGSTNARDDLEFFMTDSADHIAGKTGLTVTVTIRKPGGSFASPSGTVSEIANGWYRVAANATDNNTNGALLLHATATGADPTDTAYLVVAFDDVNAATPNVGAASSVTGAVGSVTGNVGGNVVGSVASVTGNVAGNVTGSVGSVASGGITASSIASAALTAAKFAADTGLVPIRSGTAQAGAATSITLDASASASNNFYNNCIVLITGGTGVGQARFISAYVGATKVATVGTWVTNPDNTSTFAVLPFDAVAGATAPTAAQVATAVWQDSTASDFTAANSIGKSLYTTGATPGAAGGLFIAGTNAATTISTALTANITGNLSGSVGSVTNRVTANTDQLGGDATAATNLKTAFNDAAGAVPWTGIADQGTAQAATATTIQLRSAATFADSSPIGMTVWAFGSTQGYWQARLITGYVGATDTANVDTWTVTPTGTISYKVVMSAPGSSNSPMPANVVAMATDVLTSSALAASAVTEIQTGLASQTSVDGVKAKTDQLTFTNANKVDSTALTIGVDAIDNVAIATSAVTEIQTGLSTLNAAGVRSAVGLASANLDTQLAAIPTAAQNASAVQSSATSTPLAADIRKVNSVTVNGNGSTVAWGP